MKWKDDDGSYPKWDSPNSSRKLTNRRVVGACAIGTLCLCSWLIVDSVDSSYSREDAQRLVRKPLTERAIERMEELATVVVPTPARYVPPPCAVNISGFRCPNAHGTLLNAVYHLESGSGTASSPPLYRSSAGYWLVHSPRSCLSRGAWILTRNQPDESADAVQGACDIEAHIFHSADLPVGTLEWSYASCGAAGGEHVGNRRLSLQLVQRCDCPTAGDASETDAAPGANGVGA